MFVLIGIEREDDVESNIKSVNCLKSFKTKEMAEIYLDSLRSEIKHLLDKRIAYLTKHNFKWDATIPTLHKLHHTELYIVEVY